MTFEKGNPLGGARQHRTSELEDDGTLQELQDKWLTTGVDVPVPRWAGD